MPLVEGNGLRKTFGEVVAVAGISFAIPEGRCAVLLGPNGAGKSTILNMLAGLLAPSAGTVRFDGLPEGADRRHLIGYLPQRLALFGWMTGLEYVRMAAELAGLGRAEAGERARELVAMLGLEKAQDRRIGGYSGGMKQRIGLCQALVHRPKLILLDEPVSGLDPVGRRELLDLLKELRSTSTIVFSTHVLPDAEELADDVLIVRGGEIVVDSTLAKLRARYERPIVEVELDDETGAAKWLQAFASTGTKADRRGTVVRCSFETTEAMRADLGRIYERVAAHPAEVRRVEIGQTTLEDMFLEAIRS